MKYIKIFIITISILIVSQIINISYAEEKEGIENFPDSYKPYLEELKKNHPNWNFIALYTNLDWKYVINSENIYGKNLIAKSYSDRWKNTKEGEYNVEIDAGWVDCSKMALEYTMDPRNFLNEVRIFQFEDLSYDEKSNNLQGIEKILYGTEFYNKTVEYVTSSGNTVTTSSKYSDLILSAGKTSKVNSYHLASRIKQEVGPFLSHSSISGTVEGYEGLYNFYNIGATSSSEPLGAIKNGLQYAKDGKGASESTKTKYLIPWNTKETAITGGAIFIGSSYINVGQNTLYLQKFHVSGSASSSLFWHQYMTNILAPYSESKSIYNGYYNAGILDESMNFIIPVYNNMPETIVQNPNILETDFTEDNTKVYANVTSTLNIRTGPSTSYESLIKVDKSVIMTRIAKGIQNGELWDKVLLPNGMIGYAFQNYLEEVVQIETGKVTFDESLKVNQNEITGWNINKLSVSEISKMINTSYTIKIYNYKNEELKNNQIAGTGSTIKLIDENGSVQMEYCIIIYGDVNGDGKINSIDLLVLQRHILEIETLQGVFLKAGNINKNGQNPSSVDLLLIQRHILELKLIVQ